MYRVRQLYFFVRFRIITKSDIKCRDDSDDGREVRQLHMEHSDSNRHVQNCGSQQLTSDGVFWKSTVFRKLEGKHTNRVFTREYRHIELGSGEKLLVDRCKRSTRS
jgi:hypothetical protein